MSGSARHFTIFPDIVRLGLRFWGDTTYDASAATGDVGSGNTWVNLVGSPAGRTGTQLTYAGDATSVAGRGPEFDGQHGHGFSFGGNEVTDEHFTMTEGTTQPFVPIERAAGGVFVQQNANKVVEKFTIEIWSKLAGPTGVNCGLIAAQADIDPGSTNINDTALSLRYASESGPALYGTANGQAIAGVTNLIIIGVGDRSPTSKRGRPIFQYESAGQVQTNEWQQIVYTFDQNSRFCGPDEGQQGDVLINPNPHNGTLYIDGKKDRPTGKRSYGCIIGQVDAFTTPGLGDLRVGVAETGSINPLTATPNKDKNWHGEIGCLRIYDRELSQEEVVQNYLATRRRFPANVGKFGLHRPYDDNRIGAPNEADWGNLLATKTGTLGFWSDNNNWWNCDDNESTDPTIIGGGSVCRIIGERNASPSGEVRLSSGLDPATGEHNGFTFRDDHPNAFLRVIINNQYYYFTDYVSTNTTQMRWRSLVFTPGEDFTIDNIANEADSTLDARGGVFGWEDETEFILELWSGLPEDPDGPGQEQP